MLFVPPSRILFAGKAAATIERSSNNGALHGNKLPVAVAFNMCVPWQLQVSSFYFWRGTLAEQRILPPNLLVNGEVTRAPWGCGD